MTHKSELGKFGEDLACEYLVKNNYKIIERNFRQPWGEIDIIAKSPDKTLVFIEVKTVSGYFSQHIQAEEQLSTSKLTKLKRTASLYAGHNQKLIKEDKGWRIDLLALTLQPGSESTLNELNGLTLQETSGQAINEKDCDIKHYENIA